MLLVCRFWNSCVQANLSEYKARDKKGGKAFLRKSLVQFVLPLLIEGKEKRTRGKEGYYILVKKGAGNIRIAGIDQTINERLVPSCRGYHYNLPQPKRKIKETYEELVCIGKQHAEPTISTSQIIEKAYFWE